MKTETSETAWIETVQQLHAGCVSYAAAVLKRMKPVKSGRCRGKRYGEVSIRITDRPSAHTACISWSDSLGCYYGDQTWRLSFAKRKGYCALTGNRIYPADRIYRPRFSRPAAANAEAMILASAIEGAYEQALLPVNAC